MSSVTSVSKLAKRLRDRADRLEQLAALVADSADDWAQLIQDLQVWAAEAQEAEKLAREIHDIRIRAGKALSNAGIFYSPYAGDSVEPHPNPPMTLQEIREKHKDSANPPVRKRQTFVVSPAPLSTEEAEDATEDIPVAGPVSDAAERARWIEEGKCAIHGRRRDMLGRCLDCERTLIGPGTARPPETTTDLSSGWMT